MMKRSAIASLLLDVALFDGCDRLDTSSFDAAPINATIEGEVRSRRTGEKGSAPGATLAPDAGIFRGRRCIGVR